MGRVFEVFIDMQLVGQAHVPRVQPHDFPLRVNHGIFQRVLGGVEEADQLKKKSNLKNWKKSGPLMRFFPENN